MPATNSEPSWLDYFSGGVPTGEFFRMTLDDLTKTINRSSQGLNRVNEVCFIGLVSYFEAFCKDHFASVLNIEPTLLVSLRDNGQDTLIDPSRLLEFRDEWSIRLGFLVAEKFDFGTAQKINALYGSLLKITPFSKDEAKYYEGILRDRNLFVHHGGMFTPTYSTQNKLFSESNAVRPFFDSLVVGPEYFDERLEFIKGVARKILKASHSALHTFIEKSGVSYLPERMKAVDAFLWWGDDNEI
ncbi:hypothetical protein EPO44_21985 [bacterium]|nr:MAG: hypothetical protein EPO44_21985 [bacterium]